MKRNIFALGAAAGVAAVSVVSLAATPATAAITTAIKPNSFISADTGLHNAPSTLAPAERTLAAGTPVQALCFEVKKGQEIDGNKHWFKIAVDDSTRGWVHRAVIGGVPALPQC